MGEKRFAILGLLVAVLLGIALRGHPRPDGGLERLLADPEEISGEAVWVGRQLSPSAARPLSQGQAARVMEALVAAHPICEDGTPYLLPSGVATVTLAVGGDAVVVEVTEGWSAVVSYTLDGEAHRARCGEQLALGSLPGVLREVFPEVGFPEMPEGL